MRIDGWNVEAFGTLKGFAVDDLADAPVVVVLGDNESGKSTLAAFLETMLYGFRPASRDKHPYVREDVHRAAGSVRLELSDGRVAEVHRRLLSAPKGQATVTARPTRRRKRGVEKGPMLFEAGAEGGTSLESAVQPSTEMLQLDLGNQPVAWVENVPRPLYRSLHALTLDDARELDQGTWEQVEDRLLGGAHLPFLRPAREAIDEASSRADALWRADARGKPRIKRLRDERRQARTAQSEARERHARLREIQDELAGVDAAIADARRELEQRRHDLTRAQVTVRVRAIRALEERADALVGETVLPDDPAAQHESLRQRLDELDERLESEQRARDRHRAATEPSDESLRLVDRADDVTALAAAQAAHDQDLRDVDEGRRATAALDATWSERARGWLDDDVDAAVVTSLDGAALSDLADDVESAERDLRDAERAAEAATTSLDKTQRQLASLPSVDDERAARQRLAKLRHLSELETFLRLPLFQRDVAASDDGARDDRTGRSVAVALIVLGALLAGVAIVFPSDEWLLRVGIAAIGAQFVLGALILVALGRRRASGEAVTPLAERDALRAELALEDDDLDAAVETAEDVVRRASWRAAIEREAAAADDHARDAEAALERTRDEVAERRARFVAALDDVPLTERARQASCASVVAALDRLATTARERADAEARTEAARRRADERQLRAAALLEGIGLPGGDDAMTAVAPLARKLAEAQQHVGRADLARRELPELDARIEAIEARRADVVTQLDALETELARIADAPRGEESVARGLALATEALDARRAARGRRDALEDGWEDLVDAGDEVDEITTTAAVHELQERVEDLRHRRGALEEERRTLAALPTLDDADGAVAALDEQIDHVERQRDRWALLASLVREGDRRYRQEHQPDVVRRASRDIAAMTGGRYTSLDVESVDGRSRLRVVAAGDVYPRPVEEGSRPLSRGTREQIHFAFRLALAEHLDAAEPLPMLLDEMLMTWDPRRLDEGAARLGRIGKNRQVFVFTCQPELASRLARAIGARVVRTPSLPAAPAPDAAE